MPKAGRKLTVVLFLVGFGVVLVRNAWLSDDAYITFRTIDNFVNGYGLTWNIAERVQAYTHPLWMSLLSGLYFFTREIFLTSHLFSVVISLTVVSIVAVQLARSTAAALLGITALTLSKAFVDYSACGLENPLTHLILLLFLLIYLRHEPTSKTLFFLSLLAALGMTNRMDTSLLFLPVLAYSLTRLRTRRGLGALGVGLAPFVLWELFSLFYYGSLVPNTGPAKLNVGLTGREVLFRQGWYYVLNSLRWDPLTLTLTGLGIAVPLVGRRWRDLPAIAGLLLYILYVVWIGGDFMSGRFFAAPLLGAVVLLLDSLRDRPASSIWLPLFALVLGLGLGGPRSPLLVGTRYGIDATNPANLADVNRIADERANYYSNTSLLMAERHAELPDHLWALEGRAARAAGPAVIERGSVGFFGYFAGPDIHVVDLLALGDPLLARLPPSNPDAGVGHLGRMLPDGYIQTLETGKNVIADKNLALYYDKLSAVVRGDLWNLDRLAEVWRLNTGAYDRYLDAYAYFRGETFVQHLQVTNPTKKPYVYAYVWNNGGAETFLLDSASRRGSVYSFTWNIAADGARFEGPYERQIAFGNPLADRETLNVGVFFSAGPERTPYNMFERRFWFRVGPDGRLTVIRAATEWHNPRAPDGTWQEEDIDTVISDVSLGAF